MGPSIYVFIPDGSRCSFVRKTESAQFFPPVDHPAFYWPVAVAGSFVQKEFSAEVYTCFQYSALSAGVYGAAVRRVVNECQNGIIHPAIYLFHSTAGSCLAERAHHPKIFQTQALIILLYF